MEKKSIMLGFIKKFKSDERFEHSTGRTLCIKRSRDEYSWEMNSECEVFIEIMYDYLYQYAIDLEKNIVIRDFAIIFQDLKKGFLISQGTKVNVIEVQGYRVFPCVNEGSMVKFRDRIAYIVLSLIHI